MDTSLSGIMNLSSSSFLFFEDEDDEGAEFKIFLTSSRTEFEDFLGTFCVEFF